MSNDGVAVTMVIPIMKSLVHKGYDPEQFFKYASFDAGMLKEPDARIPGAELERLMLAAVDYTQDEYFGLRQGLVMDFADMGVLGFVMMHSRTIQDSLTAYQRYNAILCSGFNIDWEISGDDVVIRLFPQKDGTMSRHCTEDMTASFYRMLGLLSSREVPLKEVQFTHEGPRDRAPYLSHFGITPQFSRTENSLRAGKKLLEYPIVYSDARLLAVFEAIAQETIDRLRLEGDFSENVLQWMKQSLPSFFPTLQDTARHFGMSTRSLQNKLKEEHTSYNELSIRVRKELAVSFLMKWNYSIGDIAYILHFSEPSAFQNAFKKWTGVTPGQYRANLMSRAAKDSR